MKRAVIYVRVSTDEQAEKGYSIPSQLDACRAYANQHGMQIVAEFADDYSGAKLDRPEFSKVRTMMQNSEVDAVIIYSADRLTRSLAHSLILRDEFARTGVERHTVLRGKSSDNAEGRMVENIEGVFAEYEREKIKERMARGKMGKAKRGLVVGSGRPPYGYEYHDGLLCVIEEEAAIIRKIFQWYVEGDGINGPLNCMQIARRLSEMQIATPDAKSPGRAKNRVSAFGIWRRLLIDNILKRETYMGIWRYGVRIGANAVGGYRSLNDTITVNVPPIIDKTLWDAAQKQREHNKQMSKRNTKREYLLRGMIFCVCGARFGGVSSKKDNGRQYVYYTCSANVGKFPHLEGRFCNQPSVRVELLDNAVWTYVVNLLKGENFEQNLVDAQAKEVESTRTQLDRLDISRRLLAKCESEAQQLITMKLETRPEGIVHKTILAKIEELDTQHKALQREIEVLEALINSQTLSTQDLDAAMRFRMDVLKGIDEATFADKRKMLQTLRVKVSVNQKTATIKCCVPVSDCEIDVSSSRR
jgi:site-specific DNA recombinase